MKIRTYLASAALVAGVVLAAEPSSYAQSITIEGLPAVEFSEAPLVTPADADAYYAGLPGGLTSPAISTEPRDPRIQRLADSLDNDPWRIYEYVANSIEVTPQFGLQKGAFGALLDRYGNPFDQAHLMVELLREAGVSASYRYGEIKFDGDEIADFTEWLGPTTAQGACELLAGGGIPAIINSNATKSDCSDFGDQPGSLVSVRMSHIWVEADLGNGLRAYDPSLKVHEESPRSVLMDTLPSAATYQTATGATNDTYYGELDVQGNPLEFSAVLGMSSTSVSNLDAELDLAAAGLLGVIQQPANMDQSLVEVVGGRRIVPANLFDAALDTATGSHPFELGTAQTWSGDIPEVLRAKFTVEYTVFVTDALETVEFDVADIAGRRLILNPLSLSGPSGGHSTSVSLFVDEESVATETWQAGCTGCSIAGYGIHVTLASDHPYAALGGAFMDTRFAQSITDLVPSVIVHSWGDRGGAAQARNSSAYAGEGSTRLGRPLHSNIGVDANSCTSTHDGAYQFLHRPSGTMSYDLYYPTPGGAQGLLIVDEFVPELFVHLETVPQAWTNDCTVEFEDVAQIPFTSAQLQSKMAIAEDYLARSEELLRLAAAASGYRHLTHQALGLVSSSADLGSDGTLRDDQAIISVSTHVVAAPLSADALTEERLTATSSLMLSALEGAVVQSAIGATEINTTASMFSWFLTSANVPAAGLGTGGSRPFLFIDAGDWTNFLHEVETPQQNYNPAALRWAERYAQSGFNLIVPLSGRLGPSLTSVRFNNEYSTGASPWQSEAWRIMGSGYLAVSPDGMSIAAMTAPSCGTPRYLYLQSASCNLMMQKGAGGASFPTDINAPSAEQDALADQYETFAAQFSVDVQTGALTYSPPADIETGSGGFPYSLGFQRTYNSQSRHMGPLGEGWAHNFQRTLSIGSDIRSATAGTAEQAVNTITAIDAILSVMDGSADPANYVNALLISDWWAKSLVNNHVSIRRGANSEDFYQVAGDSYVSSPGSRAQLLRTAGNIQRDEVWGDYGENTIDPWADIAHVFRSGFDYSSLEFTYRENQGSLEGRIEKYEFFGTDLTTSSGILPAVSNSGSRVTYGSPNVLHLDRIIFPENRVVDFAYSGGVLTSVSNNFGRSLSFQYQSTNPPDPNEPAEQPVVGSPPHGPARILTSVTDENNRTVSFALSVSGASDTARQLDSATDPSGETFEYRYDIVREWRRGLDAAGALPARRTLLTELRQPHDPSAPALTFGYDELGRLLTMTDADGDTKRYGIGEGAIGLTQAPDGARSWSWFDQDGRNYANLNPRNYVQISQFDGIGRSLRTIGRRADYEDDDYWQGSEQDYDQYNNVIEARVLSRLDPGTANPNDPSEPLDPFEPHLVSQFEYNHPGQPTWPTREIDARGNIVQVTCYSSATNETVFPGTPNETSCASLPLDTNARGGLPQAILGAEGEQTLIEYGAFALPAVTRVKIDDTQERVTEVDYYTNGLPQVSRIINPTIDVFDGDDLETHFEWTPVGDLARVVDPTSADAVATYDANRRVTSVSSLPSHPTMSQHTLYDYNESGWLVSTGVSTSGTSSGPFLTTRVTYTPAGQVETILDPDDGIAAGEMGQSFTYWSDGLLQDAIDGAGRVTRTDYYSDGQAYCVRAGYGTSDQRTIRRTNPFYWDWISAWYQSNADRDSDCGVNDAGEDGSTVWRTNSALDAYSRPANTIYPHGHRDRIFLDENGNVIERRRQTPDEEPESSGVLTRWIHQTEYDASNRATRLIINPGIGEERTNTFYNLAGEVTRVKRVGGDWLEYDYDFAGNLIAERRDDGLDTTYTYDRAGRRTSIRWHDGYTAQYIYNEAGQLIRVDQDANDNGTPERTLAAYVYDRIGRVIERHVGGRDPEGDLSGPGPDATSGIAYTYEADGDLVEMHHVFSNETVTFTYAYDGAGRLEAEHANAAGWLWSAVGDPARQADFSSVDAVRSGEATNVQNQYGQYQTTIGSAVTTYALSYDHSDNLTSDGARTFLHDTRNRLVGLVDGSETTTYTYDAIGRRRSKTVGTNATGFVHAGGMEIGEVDASGAYTIRYIPGPGVDQREAMIVHDPATGAVLDRFYYHANRLGSVIALADQSGIRQDRYVYTPYGVEEDGNTTGNPFRYAGRRYDGESGFYYYRARYYWPEVQRFLQTDPIGYADQMNLYAYVGNNPLNATDPTGMQQNAELIGQGVGILVTEWQLRVMLRNKTNLNDRQRIARRMAANFEYFGIDGREAFDYERRTRPTRMRNPSDLMPTQSTYSSNMQDENGRRQSVQDLADQLATGETRAQDVNPVRVFMDEDGVLRTLDHRRVEAARRAGVEVNTLELTLEEARAEPGAAGQRARDNRPINIEERPPRTRPGRRN